MHARRPDAGRWISRRRTSPRDLAKDLPRRRLVRVDGLRWRRRTRVALPRWRRASRVRLRGADDEACRRDQVVARRADEEGEVAGDVSVLTSGITTQA